MLSNHRQLDSDVDHRAQLGRGTERALSKGLSLTTQKSSLSGNQPGRQQVLLEAAMASVAVEHRKAKGSAVKAGSRG